MCLMFSFYIHKNPLGFSIKKNVFDVQLQRVDMYIEFPNPKGFICKISLLLEKCTIFKKMYYDKIKFQKFSTDKRFFRRKI